ncbi:MAG: M20 family peptidase [Alphaproteobacteria bacterium]|nr:M20 family peptidase [Alphaproteobacteria bacterium]
MKWVWRGLVLVLIAIAAVAGVVAVRTMTLRAPAAAAAVALPSAPQIDEAAAAARLGEAIRFRTISRTAGVVDDPDAFRALHAFLAQTYPRTHAAFTREFVNAFSLLYTLPGSDPAAAPILLLAHQDVVPVEAGTEEDWEAAPFSGALIDGMIYGRGAVDDKGSLIAILEATEALLAQGFAPRRGVILAFGHDEEVSGAGAAAMAALLRERNIRPWFALDEGMAVVLDEPTTGAPVALIGVAEKGYMSVRVTARAEGGHSSMPQADTAADKLARAIVAIRANPFEGGVQDGPAGALLDALGPRLGFMQRMAIANRWLFGGMIEAQVAQTGAGNAILRTTIAPTILEGGTKDNILPQEMHAIVNLRLHPRDSVESALAHLRAAVSDIEGVTVEPEGDPNEPSPVSSTEGDAYALLAAAAAAHAPEGAPVAPMLVLGATDSRHYVGVAENVYRFQPVWARQADLSRIHGTGERMSVGDMGRMARFYAQLIAAGAR